MYLFPLRGINQISKAKLNLINFSPLEPVAPGPDENSVGE